MTPEINKRPMSERLPEHLFTSIHEALGAASMCWIPQPGSQVFDSGTAAEVALELCRDVADWHEKEMAELIEARKVIAETAQFLNGLAKADALPIGISEIQREGYLLDEKVAHYRSLYPEGTK